MASVQIIDSTDKQETRRAGQGRYKPDVLLKTLINANVPRLVPHGLTSAAKGRAERSCLVGAQDTSTCMRVALAGLH